MSEIPDAHNVLLKLVGSQIHTITGRPNTVVEVGDTEVLVATARSPKGTTVPIEWVQDALRLAYVVLAVALVVGLVRVLLHAGQDVYYIPLYGVGIAVAAFVVAVMGIALGWRSGRFGSVVLTMLGVVVAVAAVVSFGILLLLVVLAIWVLVTRAPWGTRDASAMAAGGLLGLGVFVLALLALSPPLVDCADGSAGENVFLGLESNSSAGSVSASANGQVNRGRAEGETYAYSYECRDAKLVKFALRRR
jgi:hypothetical protein